MNEVLTQLDRLEFRERCEALRRFALVHAWRTLRQAGISHREAGSVLGFGAVTLWRWDKNYDALGISGLRSHKSAVRTGKKSTKP